MKKTIKNKRISLTRGWKKQQPNNRQRVIMYSKCGKKCFLGQKLSYPICTKNTCKINRKGVQSAYIRSRQFHRKNISLKAHKLLDKMSD